MAAGLRSRPHLFARHRKTTCRPAQLSSPNRLRSAARSQADSTVPGQQPNHSQADPARKPSQSTGRPDLQATLSDAHSNEKRPARLAGHPVERAAQQRKTAGPSAVLEPAVGRTDFRYLAGLTRLLRRGGRRGGRRPRSGRRPGRGSGRDRCGRRSSRSRCRKRTGPRWGRRRR